MTPTGVCTARATHGLLNSAHGHGPPQHTDGGRCQTQSPHTGNNYAALVRHTGFRKWVCAPGERCTMMEYWVADSKRGPLRHTPEGGSAILKQIE
eukprot:scaffold71517_cov55-Phaeocystis_antarctica.AAC.2